MTFDRASRPKNTAGNTPAIVQLTLSRFREFYREPEAVFWVFIYPVLLAAGLGIAFRSRPSERTAIAIPRSIPHAEQVAEALRRDGRLAVRVLDDSVATQELRIGDVALMLATEGRDKIEYRYDDRRPESRTARLIVDLSL